LAAGAERTAFDAAMAADTTDALDGFLAKHPVGSLARIARNERDRLVRLAALKPARVVSPTPIASPAPSPPCGGLVSLASLSTRGVAVLSPDEVCALEWGDIFKECADCPAVVVIPKGR